MTTIFDFHSGQFIHVIPCSCDVLDVIGDTSSDEERKQYFQELDTDQSNGVDFEEFLEVSM